MSRNTQRREASIPVYDGDAVDAEGFPPSALYVNRSDFLRRSALVNQAISRPIDIPTPPNQHWMHQVSINKPSQARPVDMPVRWNPALPGAL